MSKPDDARALNGAEILVQRQYRLGSFWRLFSHVARSRHPIEYEPNQEGGEDR